MTAAMRVIPAALLLVALAAAAAGDRAVSPRRVAAPVSAASLVPADLPRFALFGWVSPPEGFDTPERYAELAEAGFNVVMPAWQDSGGEAANRRRLDLARPLGLRCLLVDVELDLYTATDPATARWADTVVARYTGDPALLGWYLGDEPEAARMPRLREWFDALRERSPSLAPYNNLFGRMAFASREEWESYLKHYVDTVRPALLCADQYDFLEGGDRHQLIECAATLTALARERGVPCWGIVQLVQHRGYRAVTPGLLRWQVGHWLAYGARGIGYFTYWTPAPDAAWDWQPAMISHAGVRAPLYDDVRTLNASAAAVGNALAGMTWLACEQAGSLSPGGTPFAPDGAIAAVEGRATLGAFVDSLARAHVLVVNADSATARTVTLALAGTGRRAWTLGADGAWSEAAVTAAGRCALALAPGAFTLLRLSDAADSLVAGRAAPALDAGPNPARGRVTFSLARMTRGARLELLDLSGRRVWARDFAEGGSAAVSWSGERDGGGRVPPGIYLARLEDAHGVNVRRVSWLGGR
ncbi:MAG: T9SS type A sorting domain-containing protein [Candidatus Eisenbacteria bacterium]|uniref:T9SS type A sorting domain-containing protein n=1 Tax=Eiseniibacteriota bacterium TaxID=2212470 RepID=A0A933SE76_UNCEI|nr:T9SS type A sorting domain-containing protein [Candidatus Eisenbacteria bacterium]